MEQDNNNFEADFMADYDSARQADALDFAEQYISAGSNSNALPVPPADDGEIRFGDGTADDVAQREREAIGVGRDIGLGVIQSPRSALRGVTKGVNSMIGFLDELNDWIPAPSLFDPETGALSPALRSENDIEAVLGIELGQPEIPVPGEPKVPTVTGNMVEAVAQFATGLKGVDKIGKFANFADDAADVSRGVQFLQNVGKGGAADVLAFDEHEQRLSNVIQEIPALQNPVTEFLAADPDDSFAEGKFKQAVEGLTLGALGDVVTDGVSLMKKGRAAKAGMDEAGGKIDDLFDVPPEDAAGLGLDADNFEFLGRSDTDDLLLRKQQKLDDAADEVQGAFGKPKQVVDGENPSIDDYEINFARIEAPEDIQRLMDDMVNKPELKPSIEAARRGTRDARETLTAATDIDGFDALMARRTGDAFNAETIVAARKVYYDTTAKLMEAAKRAAAPEASDVDQFNFRKMVATHHAVQKEFMGVRAEAGRALQAWSIPVGGTSGENVRALEQVLNEFGGSDASKSLAKRLAAAGNNLNTSQINEITTKAVQARTIDAVTEAWTLGLLTNPTTHTVNLSSNVLTGFTLGMERMGAAFVKDSPVTLREGSEYFVAMIQAQKAAMKNAAEAFRTGQTGIGISKLDLPRTRATARDILDPEGKAGFISKGIDWYGGFLAKYAGGALAAGDEYSKTVLYQAQIRSLAVRDGIAQGLDGQALKEHVANVLADPPSGIRADALTFANYGTFTKELGQGGQYVQRFIAKHPMARFAVPFVRTPANIFKFTYERTPLAPISQKIRDDINAGGVRKAMALSKMGMGTSVLAIGTELSMDGKITGGGPSDQNARAALMRTGWQPYSIKIGDTYYSYARFEPLATVLGMSADLAEILSNYEAYDMDAQQEIDQLATAMVIAAGNQVVNKTFLRGVADISEALSDPERYGPQFLQRFAGSFVPAGSAALDRAINPEMQYVFNTADAIKERIPGFSSSVPARRNIWGEEIQYFYPEEKNIAAATGERIMSLFNPVYYSAEKDAPVDRWMLRNGFSINMPDKVQAFDSVKVNLRKHPEAYSRLVELRGNGVALDKYAGQTMKQFFDGLANEEDPFGRHVGFFMAIGNDFDDQQNFISQVVRDYNDAAKQQLLDEYPEISDEIYDNRRKAAAVNAVRPSLMQQSGGQ